MNYDVLNNISYGLYALTANDSGRPTGCIINTLIQVTSFEPIYMAISVNKESYTNEVIRRTGRFGINILSEDTPREVISRLGFTSGRNRDKMAGISFEMYNELPKINENCTGYLEFSLQSISDVFTHDLIIGKLTETYSGCGIPMTYKYYHEVIKGKAPKSAPTFLTNK